LTAIPVLASLLLKQIPHREPWLPRKLHALYEPLLIWCLDRGRLMMSIAAGLLLLTMLAYPLLGKTFMPTMDEGDIIVQLEKLPSITLAQSVELDQRVEAAILEQVPEVTRVVARVGSDEIGMDPMGLNETDMFMVLKPRDEWTVSSKLEIQESIRRVLDRFPGIAYGFTQPIEMRVSEMLTGVRGDVAVKLFGGDLETLNRKAEEIARVLTQIPGSQDVFTTRNEGMHYLQIDAKRTDLGMFDLDFDSVQRMLRAHVEGVSVGIVQEGVRRTPLLIKAGVEARESPSELAGLLINTNQGGSVPLSSIADVTQVEGVVSVARERGQRFSVIRSNVEGRDLVSFVDEASVKVAEQVQLPAGYYIEWGGQFENQQRAATRLALVVPLAVGLVFLMLFSSFGSVRQALLVLANIPFALIGGVFGLLLTGEYLSVPASVGFIALLGIAVLNGVVMVSYFNQLHTIGLPIRDVVITGATRRLRPVLMTASIAAFGLVPLLLASGPGSEIQRPLAIVVVGGLITATALTLILLPVLYQRFGVSGTTDS
jgi:cobalt-zinc-cadmium resistance protein CzcA